MNPPAWQAGAEHPQSVDPSAALPVPRPPPPPTAPSRRPRIDLSAQVDGLRTRVGDAPAEVLRESTRLLLDEAVSPRLRCGLQRCRGIALSLLSRFDESLLAFEAALQAAVLTGDEVLVAQCHNNRGIAHFQLGQLEPALDDHARALAIVRESPEVAAIACSNLGLVAQQANDALLSFEFFHRAWQHFPAGLQRAGAALNCGVALGRLGRLDDARNFLQRAHTATSLQDGALYHLDAACALAWVRGLQGEPAAACEELQVLERQAERSGLRVTHQRTRAMLGEMLVADGRHAEALRLGEELLIDLRRHGHHAMIRETLQWLSKALAHEGRWKQAYQLLRDHCDLAATSADSPTMQTLRQRLMAVHARANLDRPALPPPTAEEQALLDGVAAGLGNAAIARHLGMSPHTVRNRLSRLMRRLAVPTRTAMLAKAIEMDWVRVGR